MKRFILNTCLLASLLAFSACSEEGEDVRPGLWSDANVIETFPGDTVLVNGQVSNYIGMNSVTISCDDCQRMRLSTKNFISRYRIRMARRIRRQ